ncbi:MAG: hypothetical protein JXR19_09550 [Bacteroidia bacterium]
MFRFSLNLILTHIFAFLALAQEPQTENPKNEIKYLKRVIFLTELQDYESALALVDSLENEGPAEYLSNGLTTSLYLRIYEKSNDCKSAIAAYYKEFSFRYKEDFHLGQEDQFIYQKLRDKYRCIGQLDSAENYAKIIVKQGKSDPVDLTILAKILQAQGKTKEALAIMRTVEVLNNDAPMDAVVIAASLLNTEGHSQEAKDLLEPEMKYEYYMNNKEANTVMGDIYLSLGEKELACTQFKKVKSSDPISFSNHPNNGDYKYVQLVTTLMELEEKILEACR